MLKFVGHKFGITTHHYPILVVGMIGFSAVCVALVYAGPLAFVCSPEPCEVIIEDQFTQNELLTDIQLRLTALELGSQPGAAGIGFPNVNYQFAHLNSTSGDAGVKIQAAIDTLKAGVGGVVDATGFPNPQSLTPFVIPRGVTVKLPAIFFRLKCGSPIIINEGGKLIGSGANSPGATTIFLEDNCNHDVIRAVSIAGELNWWHNGEISQMRINGNRANNTSGDGIQIHTIGELSEVHHLLIHETAEAGIRHVGGTAGTNSIENVFVGDTGEAGMLFEDFSSQILLKSIGGDRNPTTFLIRNPKTGGGSMYILSLKSEGKFENTQTVVTIEGGTAPVFLTIAGGSTLGGHLETAQTIVKVRKIPEFPNQGQPHFINITGLTMSNFGLIIDDEMNDVRVSHEGFVNSGACRTFTAGGSVCRIMNFQYFNGQVEAFPEYSATS